jgi:hypothetical protein
MKQTIVVLLALALVTMGYLAHRYRAEIEARLWHLRFGQVTYVHGYAVPVPENWIARIPNQETVVLVYSRANDKSDKEVGPDSMAVTFVSHFPGDVDAWKAATKQTLNRKGLQSIEEKHIQTPDQTIECLGGAIFRDVIHLSSSTAVTMECMSTNKLSIVFTGSYLELAEFYNIASQIRRAPVTNQGLKFESTPEILARSMADGRVAQPLRRGGWPTLSLFPVTFAHAWIIPV